MRAFAVLIFLISISAEAEDSCPFPPCLQPPVEGEVKAANELFKKAKFILGAAFDSQNKHYDPEQSYKNISDFVKRTEKLKSDIKALENHAKKLNPQAGGIELSLALSDAYLCVSFDQSAMQYCTHSLNTLKSWVWEKQFGSNWSGYESSGDWRGFPNK